MLFAGRLPFTPLSADKVAFGQGFCEIWCVKG
jgi:hypothetical protein